MVWSSWLSVIAVLFGPFSTLRHWTVNKQSYFLFMIGKLDLFSSKAHRPTRHAGVSQLVTSHLQPSCARSKKHRWFCARRAHIGSQSHLGYRYYYSFCLNIYLLPFLQQLKASRNLLFFLEFQTRLSSAAAGESILAALSGSSSRWDMVWKRQRLIEFQLSPTTSQVPGISYYIRMSNFSKN